MNNEVEGISIWREDDGLFGGNAVDLFHFKSSNGHADTLPELVVLLLVVILNTSTTF